MVQCKLIRAQYKVTFDRIATNLLVKSTIFWDITPCGPLKVNRRSDEYIASISRVENKPSKIPGWKQVASLKIEAMFFSETSVDFRRTMRRYIPEDNNTLHNHRCENLRSYRMIDIKALENHSFAYVADTWSSYSRNWYLQSVHCGSSIRNLDIFLRFYINGDVNTQDNRLLECWQSSS
jgi:hypothetical protein